MAGLFRSNKSSAASASFATSLTIQNSSQGAALPLLWGTTRVTANLVWYADFTAHAVNSVSSSGGGKGGGGKTISTSYTYTTCFIMALCEGQSASVNLYWEDKSKFALSRRAIDDRPASAPFANGTPDVTSNDFAIGLGTLDQPVWGYLNSLHPDQALPYRGMTYVAVAAFDLGTSTAFPTLSYEVQKNELVAGTLDADPAFVIRDFLTNALCGVGLSADALGDLTSFSNYCLSAGLIVSPTLTSQTTAQDFLNDLLTATNSDAFFSGTLQIKPRGDQTIIAGSTVPRTVTTTVPETKPVTIPIATPPYTTTYTPNPVIDVAGGLHFVGDLGVRYASTRIALTAVASNPARGQYVVDAAGNYAFNPDDHDASVIIQYQFASASTYVAPSDAVYDLTEDDFMDATTQAGSQSASINGPIAITRAAQASIVNSVSVEYLDRTNDYNTAVVTAQDDASIATFGVRTGDQETYHFFCSTGAAQQCASLLLGKRQIRNTYTFGLGAKYILLDPADIVTLTHAAYGMYRLPVKITDIQEQQDATLLITAEEYPNGVGSAPLYGTEASAGYVPNYNVAPGDINAPLIFEPPDELAGGLEVWIGVSGKNPSTWGGAELWVSSDGETYVSIGKVTGPARQGVTLSDMATVSVAVNGQTIDAINELRVELGESGGQLTSVTQVDCLALNTMSYIGGEIVAYRDAMPIGTNAFQIEYFVRGAFGSEAQIVDHPAGTVFCRLDQGIFRYPFDMSRIGSVLYLKVLSFNIFGGGKQQLADVSPYTYKVTGSALTSPLPNVTNVRTVFEAGFMKIWWDEISDFRTGIRYRVSKGDTFAGSLSLGDVAHPPFQAFGEGTYWIEGFCQPISGLTVASEAAVSIEIAGNMLTANVLLTHDEQSGNWPGALKDLSREGPSGSEYLSLGNDIYSVADAYAEADAFNVSEISSGIYEVAAPIDIGYDATPSINCTWKATGASRTQNILEVQDFLNYTDVLGSAASAFVDSWIEIAFAPDAEPVTFGAWQKFVPGTYSGRYFKFRALLQNTQPGQVTAYLLNFAYTVSLPARIDHYQNQAIPAGGLAITFAPDGASAPAAFNGGPNANNLPYVNVSWQNKTGDQLVITNLSNSQVTIQIVNSSGAGVARSGVNVDVEGY